MLDYEEKAGQGDYGEAIADFVKGHRTVSFVELSNFLSSYMETEGDIAIYLPGYENIVIWMGISQTFVDAIEAAQATKRIQIAPSTPMIYIMDGGTLNLPIAKRPVQYKTSHWLPVVFNPCVPNSEKPPAKKQRKK